MYGITSSDQGSSVVVLEWIYPEACYQRERLSLEYTSRTGSLKEVVLISDEVTYMLDDLSAGDQIVYFTLHYVSGTSERVSHGFVLAHEGTAMSGGMIAGIVIGKHSSFMSKSKL